MRFYFLVLLFVGCISTPGYSQLDLPQLFSDHMVLQRGEAIPVWGKAKNRDRITVTLNGKEVRTRATKNGNWQLALPAMEAGGPYTLQVRGRKESKTIEDVYIGEVWICSGQSNMEWVVNNSNNAEEEIAAAQYPNIRHFKIPHIIGTEPNERIEGSAKWEVCSPQTVGNFTAVGYFFGRKLHKDLDVPIGLINTSWGGTEVEAWISGQALDSIEVFQEELGFIKDFDAETMQAKEEERLKTLFGGPINTPVQMMGGTPAWAIPVVDISSWRDMSLPGLWEDKGLPNVDGEIWFRKIISLTEAQISKPCTLSLGPIDDRDETWINGRKIGETQQYNQKRIYKIPNGVLQAGPNSIAIKVLDTGGGGGIYGNPEDLYLQVGEDKISLVGVWKYKASAIDIKTALQPNRYASVLYNGMVKPLIPYAFQGAIWYQGESNASRAHQYQSLFPLMIQDWRDKWNQGDFPFLFVQLANFRQPVAQPSESDWAELREAQTMALKLPATGMASAIDIGEADDIHPRNKQDVGLRLALHALKDTYGKKEIVSSGPSYESMEVQGTKVAISFSDVGEGLEVKDKYGYIRGFAIAGPDKRFHWAHAVLTGKNTVLVSSPKVSKPTAVRYGWADNPDDLNLYNSVQLPANPFRTDTWKGVTYG
ncbi:MAG: sialate O-acetylesterase, partial [Bacteroidota bacterium]